MSFFWESDYEGLFKGQIQFKTYVYKFVENFTGYPNI